MAFNFHSGDELDHIDFGVAEHGPDPTLEGFEAEQLGHVPGVALEGVRREQVLVADGLQATASSWGSNDS